MIIRPATDDDKDKIAQVHASSWRDVYRSMLPDEFLDQEAPQVLREHWNKVAIGPGDVVLVAEEDGVQGFIAVWDQSEPFIDNLHIDPILRSRGIGALLMQEAAAILMKTGRESAYLWVLEENKRAITFYERLGGVREQRVVKEVFGYQAPHIKMVWSDFSKMLG